MLFVLASEGVVVFASKVMSHPASSAPPSVSDSDPASSSATTATLTPEHLLTLLAFQDQIQAAVQAALTAALAPALPLLSQVRLVQ